MEYKVNRITAAFWKINIYIFTELDEKTDITWNASYILNVKMDL